MMKTYIGDSVYAEYDDCGRMILTTNNGYPDDPRNRIVLEPEVWQNLMLWLEHLEGGRNEKPQAETT